MRGDPGGRARRTRAATRAGLNQSPRDAAKSRPLRHTRGRLRAREAWGEEAVDPATRAWIATLEEARFLDGEVPPYPGSPVDVVLRIQPLLLAEMATWDALERDGYRGIEPTNGETEDVQSTATVVQGNLLASSRRKEPEEEQEEEAIDLADDGLDAIRYTLEPGPAGMWELGADFHWGYARSLAAIQAVQADIRVMVGADRSSDRLGAITRFETARKLFEINLYEDALDTLEGILVGDVRGPAYTAEWRVHFLIGILRLGFAGGDLGLVELGRAERAFAQAARFARDTQRDVAIQALTAAAFSAHQQGEHPRAQGYAEAALGLGPELPEALFILAHIQLALGEVDAAYGTLVRTLAHDRGYALRTPSLGVFMGEPEALGTFLRDVASDLWGRGRAGVQGALDRVVFLRQRAPRTEAEQALARLGAFLNEGQTWPVFDLLQCLTQRDRLVDAVLDAASDQTFSVSAVGPGPEIEVEEIYTAEKPYRERVVVRPGSLFRKEEVEWVTKTRTVTRRHQVRRASELRTTSLHYGASDVLAAFTMVRIHKGSFAMGSKPDAPHRAEDEFQHQVSIGRDYYVASHPVSQRLWQVVMGSSPAFFDGEHLPVEKVSWWEALSFCNALSRMEGLPSVYTLGDAEASWMGAAAPGYRLLTEAEWEFACRSGTDLAYWCGHTMTAAHASFGRRRGAATSGMGHFDPNPWGLYDMHGNVWEWCWDGYGPYDHGPAADPANNAEFEARVVRGGSWASEATECRSATRGNFTPWHQANNVGIRVALTAPVERDDGEDPPP